MLHKKQGISLLVLHLLKKDCCLCRYVVGVQSLLSNGVPLPNVLWCSEYAIKYADHYLQMKSQWRCSYTPS